jgi:hypothetical protein
MATAVTTKAISALKSFGDYSSAISGAWYRATENILEVGRLLSEAQQNLLPREFRSLKQNLEDSKIMSGPTISKLMAIAKDPRISKPDNTIYLPNSYATLYEITQLTDDQFKSAISEGVLTPQVELRDVKQIRQGNVSKPSTSSDLSSLIRISANTKTLSPESAMALKSAIAGIVAIKGVSVDTTPSYQKITGGNP